MKEAGIPHICLGYQQRKRRILIAAAIFSVLIAPPLILFDDGTAQARLFDLITISGYGILVLGWCYYDSLERDEPLGTGFRVLIVLLGVLPLFIYLIKSRGFKRGLLSIVIALLICAGLLLIMVISAEAVAIIFGIE